MGLDNFSSHYINMQDQHSPEYYHYSPPSVQGPASVPSVQELGPIKQEHSEQSDDSVSQMSSPPYSEPQSSDMKSISDVLKSTYGTWDRVREGLWIPRDPRDWSQDHVAHWLSWAIREFSLGSGPHIDSFISSLTMSGKELCAMNKQDFISRAPLFMGDILWAHLEILQRETDQDMVSYTVPGSLPVSRFLSRPTINMKLCLSAKSVLVLPQLRNGICSTSWKIENIYNTEISHIT